MALDVTTLPGGQPQRRQMRRVCARARSLYRRVDRICGHIGDVDTVVDEVTGIVADSRYLIQSTGAVSLIPVHLRDALDQAVVGLEQLGDYTQIPVDICNPLKAALRDVQRHVESLGPGRAPDFISKGFARQVAAWIAEHPVVSLSLAGAGGVVVTAVAAAVFVLATGPSITVQNNDCGVLDDSSTEQLRNTVLDLIPGIDISNSFPFGTTTVRLPNGLVSKFEVIEEGKTLRIETFIGPRTFVIGGLDLDASTWDATPVAQYVDKPTEVSGVHTLVLYC